MSKFIYIIYYYILISLKLIKVKYIVCQGETYIWTCFLNVLLNTFIKNEIMIIKQMINCNSWDIEIIQNANLYKQNTKT